MHATIRGIAAAFLLSACALDEGGTALPGDDASPVATLKYYADNACNNLVTSGPVDGVCNPNQNVGSNWNHFRYAATLTKVCAATGAKTAAPTIGPPTTVCCKSSSTHAPPTTICCK